MNRKDPGNIDNDNNGKKSRSQKKSNNNNNNNNDNNKSNSRNKNNNLGYDINNNNDIKNKNKNVQAGGSGAVFTVKGLSGSSGAGYLSGKINSKNQSKKKLTQTTLNVTTKPVATKKNTSAPPPRNVSVNGHRIKNSRKVVST
jgi:hypothetical protein